MKEMVCIVCPNGCLLHIEEEGTALNISGHKCKKGLEFAKTEAMAPMRSVCSTVRTIFEETPVLPVKTSRDIPKDLIFSVMDELRNVTVRERIGNGDIVISHICGTDADIIATSNILKE